MRNLLFILFFSTLTNTNLLANSDIEYLKIVPNIKKSKGLFIVFVGFGEDIEVVKEQIEIDDYFYQNGYTSLIFSYNSKFYLNNENYKIIKDIINNEIIENKTADNIIFCGFSLGGNIAFQYIYQSKLENSKLKINKLMIIDSPVNLKELYNNCKKSIIEKKCNYELVDNNPCINDVYIVWYFDTYLNDIVQTYSPYHYFNTKNKIKLLKNIDILFVSDADPKNYSKAYPLKNSNYNSINAFYKLLKSTFKNNSNKIILKNKINYKNLSKIKTHSWHILDTKTINDFLKK